MFATKMIVDLRQAGYEIAVKRNQSQEAIDNARLELLRAIDALNVATHEEAKASSERIWAICNPPGSRPMHCGATVEAMNEIVATAKVIGAFRLYAGL